MVLSCFFLFFSLHEQLDVESREDSSLSLLGHDLLATKETKGMRSDKSFMRSLSLSLSLSLCESIDLHTGLETKEGTIKVIILFPKSIMKEARHLCGVDF